MINTGEFRNLIQDVVRQELGEPTRYKIGEIASVGDKVQVKFSGEETASLKEYTYLKSYYPVVGDRVLLARYSGTYVVLGKINRDISEPFYMGGDLQVGGDVYINNALAGYIVESGENSNGRYVKFSDGTMICGVNKFLGTVDITSAHGSLYGSQDLQWNFSASFSTNDISFSGTVSGAYTLGYIAGIFKSATIAWYRIMNPTSRSPDNIYVSLIAIGKWK